MIDELQLRNVSEIRGAFKAKGAIGAANAQPGKYLGAGTPAFENLLRAGVIREGAPGSFYLYDSGPVAFRIVKQILFWLLVILLPIFIIQFTTPGK
ncbi:MAG: hypothetical protein M3Z17_08380 [Gemmatimonadota bacterium]|nr:hypothetical protein [Gemmatimonadota bacterium]